MALARGDGNGRKSIWARMDLLEEQIDDRFKEQGKVVGELGDRMDAHILESSKPRPDCERRMRNIEELIGFVWPRGERGEPDG